jgi:methionine sulfoxide reductase heme-binding subunit
VTVGSSIAVAATTSSPKAFWYFARGSGIVTLLLLTASTVLGLLSTARAATREWSRFVVQAVHRNVSLLIVVFLGLHVATIVLDGFVPVRWVDAVIPFLSQYKPLWVGLGAIVVDLLAAVIVTSLWRVRIGARAWRTVHWLAYAAWPVAVLHGVGVGSDRHERWYLAITALCVASVVVTAAWRWARRVPDTPAVIDGRVVESHRAPFAARRPA